VLRAAAVALLLAFALGGCGGSSSVTQSGRAHTVATPHVEFGPAFGLTEDNAELLYGPAAAPATAAAFAHARERLSALHPQYVRLLVDWAALQPDADRAPALEGEVDGCARIVAPCGNYAGIREQLAAIAGRQRAARAEGRPGYEVVLDVFGVPNWAAVAASGCELSDVRPFSRPISAAGLAGYKALIRSLLALGAREGVPLQWWAPWNEPNDLVFLSPQRSSCSTAAPSTAPAVYAQLAEAMAAELHAVGGTHRLLLGELNAFQSGSPHRTSISEFVDALPASVLCLGDVWSIHDYAIYAGKPDAVPEPEADPVAALEAALDGRGECGRHADIWVTETGAGAPHPGRPRLPDAEAEREGCMALARLLDSWTADPRVQAVFQYSFREDPAFPVGLLSADLTHTYPTYRLWLSYARARARGRAPATSSSGALCA
jgi:hypothetical protein